MVFALWNSPADALSAGLASRSGIAAVLAAGGNSAADVSFRFVFIQDFLYPKIETSIIERKPLLDVFMFGRYELEWFHPAQDYQAAGDKYPRFHLCLLQFFG